jgi:hypothetical protein
MTDESGLYKYGIEEEQSDIRAHVSFIGRCVTVFRTADILALVSANAYRETTATQQGVSGPTAKGVLVPIADIEPKYILTSDKCPWQKFNAEKTDLAALGRNAVAVVKAAIKANKFPMWVCGIVETDKEIDIQGTDIVVNARRRIQVKCDWGACPKEDGGTGNLFIQTHERNPLKIH